MAGLVASTVVSEITRRAISKIIGMVNKQGSVSEKLRKLDTLCTKINGAVAASEDRITGTYLLKWQEKLREAGIEGEDILFGFRWRAMNEASKSSNHQIGTLGALTCTKIATSNIVNYFRNAVKMLLSNNEDFQKLNSTVEMLEKLSADNEEFSTLVELDVLMREEQAPAEGEKQEILGKPSTYNEELEKLVELEILAGEEHAPAKGKKPDNEDFSTLVEPDVLMLEEQAPAEGEKPMILEKPSTDNEELEKLVELEILAEEEHAPAKGKKPDNEEFSTLVELDVLMLEEQAPAEGEKPKILEKPSTDNEELEKLVEIEILAVEEHAPAKAKKPVMLEKLPADNHEISRLIELEVFKGEEHAPAKGKKPVVTCDHSLLKKEVHQHSNRKRAVDSVLESTEMRESVKRVALMR